MKAFTDKRINDANHEVTIAVIGAGLMGRLTALELHRCGYHVTLIDKDNKDGKASSAYAAAGLLTPLGEALHADTSIVEMGLEALTLWPSILSSLDEHVFFQQAGALMVSHEQDKGDYERHQRFLFRYFKHHNIQALDRQQLLELEPELGRNFQRGLYLPPEGQLGNRRLLIALKNS